MSRLIEYYTPYNVVTRDGSLEPVDFTKISNRIIALNSRPFQLKCNPALLVQGIIGSMHDNIKTSELDEMGAHMAEKMWSQHSDFQILAGRIIASNHQKQTVRHAGYSDVVDALHKNVQLNGQAAPRVNDQYAAYVQYHRVALDAMIDYALDFRLTYFSLCTMLDKYLVKRSGVRGEVDKRPQDYCIERPQDMWMRVAVAMWCTDVDVADASRLPLIKKTYMNLALGKLMLATPVIYNSGTLAEQKLSCFVTAGADSMESILDLVKDLGIISKYSGGVGWWWNLRPDGAEIKGINGYSDGPENFLRIMETVAIAVNQGSKRKGSFANFEKPTNPFFKRWCQLKRDNGGGIPHLFYGAWIPDRFMLAAKRNEPWYQFDPVVYPEIYAAREAKEYARLYDIGVERKLYWVGPDGIERARVLLNELATTIIMTGMPYVCFDNAVNSKTNQINLDPAGINSSNLCTEVMQISKPDKYSCCVVGHVCLPNFVRISTDGKTRTTTYDFEAHGEAARDLVVYLDRIIDTNLYKVKKTEDSNREWRPLIAGVQGEADVYAKFRWPFTSDKSKALCAEIYECHYYNCLRQSCELAKIHGPYKGFEGSPFSRGIFQWQMWGIEQKSLSGRWDWDDLRADVMKYGVRNSLLTGLPPTATTSHLQGNSECFEPFTEMMYVRRIFGGEFTQINHFMIAHLIELGLWTTSVCNKLISASGSLQDIKEIPEDVRAIYQTAYEYKTKDLLDMQRIRGGFLDQSASNNQFMKDPTIGKVTQMLFQAWMDGAKTGMYYLKMKSSSKPIQFSEKASDIADKLLGTAAPKIKTMGGKKYLCTDEVCEACT